MFFIPKKCIMLLVDALEDLRAFKRKCVSRVERIQCFPAIRIALSRKIDSCVLRSLISRLPIFKGPITYIKISLIILFKIYMRANGIYYWKINLIKLGWTWEYIHTKKKGRREGVFIISYLFVIIYSYFIAFRTSQSFFT